MELDSTVTHCQESGGLEDCNSKHYLESVRDQCHCLPISLKSFSEADTMVTIRLFLLEYENAYILLFFLF